MNRYFKLQNGDIFDNQTRTTISREKLLEICNRMDNILDPDWKKFIDRVTDETTYKKAMEIYDELARDENSVLD